MDLALLEKKELVLIPTPGQTEQIYLAEYLKARKIFFSISQKQFDLEEAMTESLKYSVKNLPAEKTYKFHSFTQYELLFQE